MQTDTEHVATVDPRMLQKVDRLFDAAPDTIWTELLQNSRRAGATEVRVTMQSWASGQENPGGVKVWFMDNGSGMESPAKMLRLAAEGWDTAIEASEDPAGMGFFSMCNFSVVDVRSQNWDARFTPAVFRGEDKLIAHHTDRTRMEGTLINWSWEGTYMGTLRTALRAAARYCGIDRVRLDADNESPEIIETKDFLDGYEIEDYGDYRIGVRAGADYDTRTLNRTYIALNFRGCTLSLADTLIPGGDHPSLCHVRVDVRNTSGLKLVLPARNALKHNEARDLLLWRCEKRAYEWLAATRFARAHELPFSTYDRALNEFQVDIGEAARRLGEWLSYYREQVMDTSAILVACDMRCNQIFKAAAAHGQAAGVKILSGSKLFRPRSDYEGYSWYDALPRISSMSLVIDGREYGQEADFDDLKPDTGFVAVVDRIELKCVVTKADSDPDVIQFDLPLISTMEYPTDSFQDLGENSDLLFVTRGVVESPLTLARAVMLLKAMCFEPTTDGDDPDSTYEQERMWDEESHSFLLEKFMGRADSLLFLLGSFLERTPFECRDSDCEWTVTFKGVPRDDNQPHVPRPRPMITSCLVGGVEYATNNQQQ